MAELPQIFTDMGITKTQFVNAVKNKKDQIVPLVQAQRSAVTDKSKGVAVINAILDAVGSANAGGYDAIARNFNVPESHAQDIDRAFIDTVIAMYQDGDLD